MKILLAARNKQTEPLHAFLEQISDELRERILSKLNGYAQHGSVYSSTSLKTLNARIWKYKGTIYKLRVDNGAESARVLFARNADDDLVVIHGFLKSTRKTPAKEAKQAIGVFQQLSALDTQEWSG